MKKLIAIIAVSAAFISTSVFAAPCPNVVFLGKTLNHKKEVFICQTGNNELYYSFGKVGESKPELSLRVNGNNSNWQSLNNAFGYSNTVEIKNGKYTYAVGSGTGEESAYASVVVSQSDKGTIANIKLDPKTVKDNISSLRESSIPELD